MLAKYAVGYLSTGIAFALIDSIWLRTMYTRLYQPELGPLLGSLKLGPAVVFYLLYIAGMMWFAVAPALANGRWQTALIQGAVLGCLCYATYDLTNQATLKMWSTKVTVLDIMWGTVLTGSASLTGWWVTTAIFGRN
ncbi:MAG: hypothetical protein CFE32_19260 [Alphaproteobacteria bacterium PA3]|nr:MAG: hypothetical protein CFE32_19260 [Alphaproteobacteria bacterium PA3]